MNNDKNIIDEVVKDGFVDMLTAKWIYNGNLYYNDEPIFVCSNCKFEMAGFLNAVNTIVCPHCYAKMKCVMTEEFPTRIQKIGDLTLKEIKELCTKTARKYQAGKCKINDGKHCPLETLCDWTEYFDVSPCSWPDFILERNINPFAK